MICDIKAEIPGWETERRFYFDPEWNPGRQVLIHACPGSTYRIDWQAPAGYDLAQDEATGGLDQRIRHVIGDRPYDIVWKSVYRFHSRHADEMRLGQDPDGRRRRPPGVPVRRPGPEHGGVRRRERGLEDRVLGKGLGWPMVGTVDPHGEPVTAHAPPERDDARPVLAIRSAPCPGAFTNVDLELRSGQLVGVAGLVGSGRSELLEAVFAARSLGSGLIEVDGTACPRMVPRAAIAAGIGYVPPDRKAQGLVLSTSVRHNLTMAATHSARRLVPPEMRAERQLVARLAATVRLHAPSMSVAGSSSWT